MQVDVNAEIRARAGQRPLRVPDFGAEPLENPDDPTGILRDEAGNPVHPPRPMVFADVAVAAIDQAEQDDKPAGPMGTRGRPTAETVDLREYRRRSRLADRIAEAREPIDIDLADRALLLKAIAKRFPAPLYVDRCWQILDPDGELTDTGEAPKPTEA